jgi:membrane fusion protein (multidrug efflux system)
VAPATALAAASLAGPARAAVPTGLAKSTVAYAATASAVPTSVFVITEGVLISMFLRKVKLVMTAAAVGAALAAGAVVLAQSGIGGRPKDRTVKPQHVGSPSWTYHILASRHGEPPRKVAVVEITDDTPIRVDAPGALILIQPKRVGEPDRQTAPENDHEQRKIVLTSPKAMDVAIAQRYVCQIRSQRHINLCALDSGQLNEIKVSEGQEVKKGDLMFKIVPTFKKKRLDAKKAEARLAELEYLNTKKLSEKKPAVVSENEVLLFDAKRLRAKAGADLEQAELNPTLIEAPFDGIVDRLHKQLGSLVNEGDVLATLSDNSVMWVYFNVPEARYLEYMANRKQHAQEDKIELELANHKKFPQTGKIGAIEAKFNNETGNIPFRADFPNPDGLLRPGQTGTILIHRMLRDALVIPMRSTFENLDKRYVYVVGKDDVVHQREIVIHHELDDLFVVKKGVGVGDRIMLDGIQQVRDGEKVEYEFRPADEGMRKPRNHAE